MTESGTAATAGSELASVTAAPPTGAGLVRLTEFEAKVLPPVMVFCDKVTATTPTPVPVKLTVSGVPGTLPETVSVPDCTPAVAGLNVTVMVHRLPAMSEAGQSFTCENGAAAVTPLMFSGALPVFVIVTVWTALPPAATAPKLTLVVEAAACGVWSKTETMFAAGDAVARSRAPSLLKSATATAVGPAVVVKFEGPRKVPSLLLLRIEMLLTPVAAVAT